MSEPRLPALSALHLTLVADQPTALAAGLHDHLQAAALALVRHSDPALATALHDRPRDKPYTVGSLLGADLTYCGAGDCLAAGQSLLWRLTGLAPEVTAAWQAAAAAPPGEVVLGGLRLAVSEAALAGLDDCADLYGRWLGDRAGADLPDRWRFDFPAPTAIRYRGADGRNRSVLWPTATLLLTRWAERWRRLAPAACPLSDPLPGGDSELVAWCGESLRVVVQGHQESAFLGSFEFALPPDPLVRRFAGLLGEFAPFAGLGHRTTAGFGMVRSTGRPTRRDHLASRSRR